MVEGELELLEVSAMGACVANGFGHDRPFLLRLRLGSSRCMLGDPLLREICFVVKAGAVVNTYLLPYALVGDPFVTLSVKYYVIIFVFGSFEDALCRLSRFGV